MKATKDLQQFREKDSKALFKELADLNKKLVDLKFKASFKKIKNFKEINYIKKNIARIWTILSQRAQEELAKKE